MKTASKPAKLSIRELTAIALLSTVMALTAQIYVPLPPIPFTLQTLGVLSCALLLPRRQAVYALAVYLLLGLVGLPVFAGGRAGLGVLAGPSGGFLYGFLPAVGLAASLLKQGAATPLPRVYLAGFLLMPCYFAIGTLHCALVLQIGLGQAFAVAAAPFLLIDALKIAVFTPLVWKLRRLLHRQIAGMF